MLGHEFVPSEEVWSCYRPHCCGFTKISFGLESLFWYYQGFLSTCRSRQIDTTQTSLLYLEAVRQGYRNLRKRGVNGILAWNTAKSSWSLAFKL